MTPTHPIARLWPLLMAAAGLAVVSIAVLWPLRTVAQPCIAIYPAPPGCGATEHHWAALFGIALIIALLAAIVVARFTMQDPRVTIIVLLASMGAILLGVLAVIAITQSGMWNTPIPIDPLILE